MKIIFATSNKGRFLWLQQELELAGLEGEAMNKLIQDRQIFSGPSAIAQYVDYLRYNQSQAA